MYTSKSNLQNIEIKNITSKSEKGKSKNRKHDKSNRI